MLFLPHIHVKGVKGEETAQPPRNEEEQGMRQVKGTVMKKSVFLT